KIADLVAPYLALGQAIGRLGCFLNGCCYGKAVSWGLFFPVHGAHLHPVQLYTSFDLLIIFFILKKYQRLERNSGETFVLYLILASLERFCMEFLRADHVQVWLGLSIFQIVSITIFAAATYVILLIRSRRKK
ncbi:MAG: prolipoprotein diacylglyceryl transferase family protein, partial [Candidatus Omnitrophota bacterium]